jgi:3-methyladenine DNA glycosylase AlkD
MNKIVQQLRAELRKAADPLVRKSFQRFFKEKIVCYGIKTGEVRKIAAGYWKQAKELDKSAIFDMCEELFESGYCEESFVAAMWAPKLGPVFEKKDLALFEAWIKKYITNWAACDSFCNHTLGDFFEKYPDRTPELRRWAGSANRWLRRAAAVSLIVPAKHGKFLKEIFCLSKILLTDPDDMVQKGYGWLLKEASRLHRKEVFDFVVARKKDMPRTALRYAIELMPKPLKNAAMSR